MNEQQVSECVHHSKKKTMAKLTDVAHTAEADSVFAVSAVAPRPGTMQPFRVFKLFIPYAPTGTMLSPKHAYMFPKGVAYDYNVDVALKNSNLYQSVTLKGRDVYAHLILQQEEFMYYRKHVPDSPWYPFCRLRMINDYIIRAFDDTLSSVEFWIHSVYTPTQSLVGYFPGCNASLVLLLATDILSIIRLTIHIDVLTYWLMIAPVYIGSYLDHNEYITHMSDYSSIRTKILTHINSIAEEMHRNRGCLNELMNSSKLLASKVDKLYEHIPYVRYNITDNIFKQLNIHQVIVDLIDVYYDKTSF